jgi:hypothetical protein
VIAAVDREGGGPSDVGGRSSCETRARGPAQSILIAIHRVHNKPGALVWETKGVVLEDMPDTSPEEMLSR